MKPIVLYLQKQNLIIGVILALLLVLYLKYFNAGRVESFLTLKALTSLCNRKYTQTPTDAGIPKKKSDMPTPPKQPPKRQITPTVPLSKYIRQNKNKASQCKFGIDVNPPSQKIINAIPTLSTVSKEEIDNLEKNMAEIPEFENIMNSGDKPNLLKLLYIFLKLIKATKTNISDTQSQHITTTILSVINMVDPQIASAAASYYSNTDTNPETNPFYNIDKTIPASELTLNTEAVDTILSEPIQELTPENIDKIAGVLTKIKIFMPYEECEAILTRHISS